MYVSAMRVYVWCVCVCVCVIQEPLTIHVDNNCMLEL